MNTFPFHDIKPNLYSQDKLTFSLLPLSCALSVTVQRIARHAWLVWRFEKCLPHKLLLCLSFICFSVDLVISSDSIFELITRFTKTNKNKLRLQQCPYYSAPLPVTAIKIRFLTIFACEILLSLRLRASFFSTSLLFSLVCIFFFLYANVSVLLFLTIHARLLRL